MARYQISVQGGRARLFYDFNSGFKRFPEFHVAELTKQRHCWQFWTQVSPLLYKVSPFWWRHWLLSLGSHSGQQKRSTVGFSQSQTIRRHITNPFCMTRGKKQLPKTSNSQYTNIICMCVSVCVYTCIYTHIYTFYIYYMLYL